MLGGAHLSVASAPSRARALASMQQQGAARTGRGSGQDGQDVAVGRTDQQAGKTGWDGGQGGQDRAVGRAGPYLVAAVLVEHDQEDGHGHDDADHDEGVEDGVEQALAHRGRVLGEWCVDAEGDGGLQTLLPACSIGPAHEPPSLSLMPEL